jgi:hypothetical protein
LTGQVRSRHVREISLEVASHAVAEFAEERAFSSPQFWGSIVTGLLPDYPAFDLPGQFRAVSPICNRRNVACERRLAG